MENSRQALARARKILEIKGVSNVGLDSLILLAHALSASKEWVIFNPDFELSTKQQKIFSDLVERRANREPVSHLIERREFFGEDFLVNKDVLDPRPDSEILIEAVFKKFPNHEEKLKILELGVGSGCLVITLLKAYKNAAGTGVDISNEALRIAEKNSAKHQTDSRLQLLRSDLFSALNHEKKFDLILSNPPYIPSHEIETLEPEVKIYEPRGALDGGEDGLEFYRRIAAEAKKFLDGSGKTFLEIGCGQEAEIAKIFTKQSFFLTNSTRDLSGVIRVLEFS